MSTSSSSSRSSFDIVASWPSPLPRSKLHVSIGKQWNRTPVTTVDSHCIDARWQDKVTKLAQVGKAHRLFNGTKFRLDGVDTTTTTTVSDSPVVTLRLGITDYKTSLGCVEGVEEYRTYYHHSREGGQDDAGSWSSWEKHLSQALGVESLLITSDGYAVLFRRSQDVAEMPGWYCCPGGHPEPKNIYCAPPHFDSTAAAAAAGDTSLDEQAQWFSCVNESIVTRELYDSAVDEVCAELGLPAAALTNNGLIAVVQNRATRKPDLVFLIRTTMSSEEVQHVFERREAEEAYESEEDGFLLIKIAKEEDIDQAIASHLITPPSVACLQLGSQVLLR